SRLLQTTRSPSFGHLVRMPVSVETLSPVGPRKRGQSLPCFRVARSGRSPADEPRQSRSSPSAARMERMPKPSDSVWSMPFRFVVPPSGGSGIHRLKAELRAGLDSPDQESETLIITGSANSKRKRRRAINPAASQSGRQQTQLNYEDR